MKIIITRKKYKASAGFLRVPAGNTQVIEERREVIIVTNRSQLFPMYIKVVR